MTPPAPPAPAPKRQRVRGRDRQDDEKESGVFQVSGGSLKAYGTFESMQLKPGLLRGLISHGFTSPSPIQQRALVPILNGRDLVAQDRSGVGKTTMVGIAVNQIVDAKRPHVQAVLLSPTRELASQTARTVSALGERHLGTKCCACVGGTSVSDDVKNLSGSRGGSATHVVSGTPGRVLDLIKRHQAITPRHVRLLVLDEADEMLGLGFKEQIFDVYRFLPPQTQVVLVSATMSEEIMAGLALRFMADPVRISVQRESALTLRDIQQYFVHVDSDEWKFDALCDLYDKVIVSAQSVIFLNERSKVEWLARRLRESHFSVSAMHGDMPQRTRDEVMLHFRQGKSRVLLTTDLVGRGVDVAAISLVINYDLPPRREQYLHRIGRCGRYGRKGLAVSLTTNEDIAALRKLERAYAVDIKPLPERFN